LDIFLLCAIFCHFSQSGVRRLVHLEHAQATAEPHAQRVVLAHKNGSEQFYI
jgi:hypothetical protein